MNWNSVLLSENCSVITKGTTPTSIGLSFSDNGIPFVRVQNLKNGIVTSNADTLFIDENTHEKLNRSKIYPNDILISIAGTIGRAAIVPADAPEMNCNQAVAIVRPNENINRRFFLHWLRSSFALEQIRKSKVTAIISNLSLAQIGALQIPLPPLDEQKRIAAILDQADALHRLRTRAIDRLNTLGQSIFYEMFGDPVSNTLGWPVNTVGSVTDCIVPGRDKPKSFTGNIPWITTAELVHLGDTGASQAKASLSQSEISEVRARVIPSGSVLMTCVGNLGVASIAETDLVINQQLHSFQCGPNVESKYLMFALSYQKNWMYKMATKTTLPYMNKSVCNSIPIQLPPIEKQIEFSSKIERIFKAAIPHEKSMRKSEYLFDSLQQRAFRGEL